MSTFYRQMARRRAKLPPNKISAKSSGNENGVQPKANKILQLHHPTVVSMMRKLIDGLRTVGIVASFEP